MKKYQLHIAADIVPYPESHEISAGFIIANYLQSNVIFIKRHENAKSPDFKIGRVAWELKSPTGNGRRTIQNNLRAADRQSVNVILDLRRIKLHAKRAEHHIRHEIARANRVKRLIVITKQGDVLEIK